MELPKVFYTCEWALAVQSAYEASLKPLLFLGYDGDDLVGVACLAADPAEQNISFLNATTADYCEFLSHPERRAEFVDKVFAELRQLGTDNLVLASLPADSATPAALRTAAKKYGFHLYIRPSSLCPQVELGSPDQRQELKTAITRKRQLRRCLKAMEREGPVTCVYLKSWDQIQAVLPDFVNIQVARFRAKNGASFLSAPERRLLYGRSRPKICRHRDRDLNHIENRRASGCVELWFSISRRLVPVSDNLRHPRPREFSRLLPDGEDSDRSVREQHI